MSEHHASPVLRFATCSACGTVELDEVVAGGGVAERLSASLVDLHLGPMHMHVEALDGGRLAMRVVECGQPTEIEVDGRRTEWDEDLTWGAIVQAARRGEPCGCGEGGEGGEED